MLNLVEGIGKKTKINKEENFETGLDWICPTRSVSVNFSRKKSKDILFKLTFVTAV